MPTFSIRDARQPGRQLSGRFERLYDEHRKLVFAYFCARLPSSEEAEDATIETFMEAWKSWARTTIACSERLWLLGIARRVAARRYAAPPPSASLEDSTVELADGHNTEDQAVLRNWVVGLLATLKPIESDALWLHDGLQLSCEEVAQLLEVPAGTVMSHLFRARRKLLRSSEEVGA
ncbi:MAG: sigma-70 family RNA polymerase sigma factor [Fimbriimonas ginsengisoli]|uniref:Sigma-70 family RNA polymerase sigma factor n=1 Tax=Fimbriimonas ginsengisoli TaxID=1005039 RepID=A0A931PWG1_FIMGI|nr:sigma-70 family RNA polymerase sigma factor [Fimbriimonas ginsengisoli]